MSTGTSTSGPMTAANAAREWMDHAGQDMPAIRITG